MGGNRMLRRKGARKTIRPMDKILFRRILWIVTYTILLVALLIKLDLVAGFAAHFLSLLSPLFIGGAIAFILCRPQRFLEKKLCPVLPQRAAFLAKPFSIAGVYLLLGGVVFAIVAFLLPQLMDSVRMLYSNIALYTEQFQRLLNEVLAFLHLNNIKIDQLFESLSELPKLAGEALFGMLPQVLDATGSVVRSVTNTVLGFVISVYLLADREKLGRSRSDQRLSPGADGPGVVPCAAHLESNVLQLRNRPVDRGPDPRLHVLCRDVDLWFRLPASDQHHDRRHQPDPDCGRHHRLRSGRFPSADDRSGQGVLVYRFYSGASAN